MCGAVCTYKERPLLVAAFFLPLATKSTSSYVSLLPHTHTLSSEKGILKKPGPPYCGLDRLSSSSQNNLVNLTDRRDRPEISDVERTLKSLNGYHEDILEVRADRPDKLPTSQEMTVNLI